MDIDRGTGSSTKSRSKKSGRIQKRRTKNSIVFAKNAYGVKQPSKKRKWNVWVKKLKKGLESSYWITAKAGVWSWVAASLCSFSSAFSIHDTKKEKVIMLFIIHL